MSKPRILFTPFFAFVALLLASCTRARIEGQVLDAFGAPVSDATVRVQGTTFSATTNAGGKYSVQYVPGEVAIEKEGFVPKVQKQFNIASESLYPAESVTLYKIPTDPGMYFISKKQYIPLKNAGRPVQHNIGNVFLSAFEYDFGPAMWDDTTKQFDPLKILKLPPGKTLRFLDTDGKENGLFLIQHSYGMRVFPTRTAPEVNTDLGQNVFLREVKSPPAEIYAFATRGGGTIFQAGVTEPAYFFSVTNEVKEEP